MENFLTSYSHIDIRESGNLGNGIFANRLIQKGEQILKFTGPIISFEEMLARPPEVHSYPLQITKAEYIDLEVPGVLVNHSCDPNAVIKNSCFLVALKEIQPGQEIFYDYSTTILDEDDWTMICQCGSKNCRLIIGDFRSLPSEIQKKYLQLDMVQPFIKEYFVR